MLSMTTIPEFNFSFRDYFNPLIPEKWDALNAARAKDIDERVRLYASGVFLLFCINTITVLCKFVSIGFIATLLTPSGAAWAITMVALYCLTRYLFRLAKSHMKGLTKEMIVQLAYEQLKIGLQKLEIFTSQEQLDSELKTRTTRFSDISGSVIKNANRLHSLANVEYNPKKDIQPWFKIYSWDLKDDQIQELLDIAYERGIILEFSKFSHDTFLDKKQPGYDSNVKRDFKCDKEMTQALDCAVEFLARRLEKNDVDVAKINTQLNALGFKWVSGNIVRVMKPPIYLENEGTIIIRGNCNEVLDLSKVLERVDDCGVTIKIYKVGLCGVVYLYPDEWEKLKKSLPETRYELQFIESREALDKNYSIWQENPHHFDPGIIDIFKQSFAESDRIAQIEKNRTAAVPTG